MKKYLGPIIIGLLFGATIVYAIPEVKAQEVYNAQ